MVEHCFVFLVVCRLWFRIWNLFSAFFGTYELKNGGEIEIRKMGPTLHFGATGQTALEILAPPESEADSVAAATLNKTAEKIFDGDYSGDGGSYSYGSTDAGSESAGVDTGCGCASRGREGTGGGALTLLGLLFGLGARRRRRA